MPDADQARTSPTGTTLYRAVGCPDCAMTGYRGRFSIVEVLTMNPELERRIGAGRHRRPDRRGGAAQRDAVAVRERAPARARRRDDASRSCSASPTCRTTTGRRLGAAGADAGAAPGVRPAAGDARRRARRNGAATPCRRRRRPAVGPDHRLRAAGRCDHADRRRSRRRPGRGAACCWWTTRTSFAG